MKVGIVFDSPEIRRGVKARQDTSDKSLEQILNQTAANVITRTLQLLPPRDEDSKRLAIQLYLNQQRSTKVKVFKHGKRKGQFGPKGRRQDNLILANLIVQAHQAKAGLKGLYGRDMRVFSGAFRRRASVSVGFAKSIYIPMAAALNPVVRNKIPLRSLTKKISRWPGSSGFGTAVLAKAGSPEAVLDLRVNLHHATSEGRLMDIESRALGQGMAAEGQEMVRHAEEKLEADLERLKAI